MAVDDNRRFDETWTRRTLNTMRKNVWSGLHRDVVTRAPDAPAPRRSRRSLAKVGIIVSTITAVIGGTAGIAFANAANPLADSQGTAVLNPDGTVTVTVGGTWDWGAQTVGHGAQACSGRWGVGWAVDWWGMSSSLAAASISHLTTTSGVPLTPGGAIKDSSGQYFHVNTNNIGTISGASGPVGPDTEDAATAAAHAKTAPPAHTPGAAKAAPPANTPGTAAPTAPAAKGGANAASTTRSYSYDGVANFAVSCTPDASGDASGPWTATAVYPDATSVPAQLCVIMYDMHGSEGKPSGSASDYSTTADNDNSIKTNAFDPSSGGGYCFTPHFVTNVSVKKTGPATGLPNGQGTYDMVATNAGSADASNVVITDTLPAGESYVSSTDAFGTCTNNGQVVSCPVGTLTANGGQKSISVIVSYAAGTAGQTLTDCATVSGGSGQSCVPTIISAQNLVGHIYFCQNGSQTTTEAPGGTISAAGPTGETVASAANPIDSSVQNAGSWTVSANAPTKTQFVACGGPSESGTTATQTVNVPVNGTGTANFYVVSTGPFQVNLTKAASATQVTAGQGFSYTLVATNTGGAVAPAVVVTDAVPSQVTVTGTPTSTQGTCSLSGNNVTCNVGDLAANGGSATITINVATTTASCGTVNNMGQVTADGGTTGNSNTVTTTITCSGPPNITVGVVKTNNAQDPNGTDFGKVETAQTLGETFNYQAVITNTSTVTEVLGTLTDTVAGQPIQDICPDLVGQTLASQASLTCTFQGVAPSTSGASITDRVTVPVSQLGNPSNTGTGTDTSTVNTAPGVIITKASNAAGTGFGQNETVAPGSTSVPYQVTVTNPNSAPGTITSLTDTIDGATGNICPDLVGKVLDPKGGAHDTVVCNFTTTVPTSVTTDTAAVNLSVNGVVVPGSAQTTVFPPVLGEQITPGAATPAPALAFTGFPVGKMMAVALGAIAAGLLLLGAVQVAEVRRQPQSRFHRTS